jgi:hypothetical protein
MKYRLAAVVCAAVLCGPRPAAAQPSGRITVGGGLAWMGGAGYGSADASEVTASGGSFRLFSTSSDLTTGTGVNVSVGVRLTRLFEVEAQGSYLRPSIETKISNDFEGGQGLTATDRLRQFTVEGAVLYTPSRWRAARVSPFGSGSAGYLRQLHDGDGLAVTGSIFGVGGGARMPLVTHAAGSLKSFGVRADLRAVVRTKAAAVDGRAHTSPAVAVGVFATF